VVLAAPPGIDYNRLRAHHAAGSVSTWSGFVWLTGVSRRVGHLEGGEEATYLGGQTSAMWLLSTPLYTGDRFGSPYVDTVHSAFFERVAPCFEAFFAMPAL
jgi:hypothetical protein